MPDQGSGRRVPEEVGALARRLDAKLVDRALADTANARRTEGPVGSLDAQEHLLVPTPLADPQIRQDGVADVLGHRHPGWTPKLAHDTEPSACPVDVCEAEPTNISGAQCEPCEQ